MITHRNLTINNFLKHISQYMKDSGRDVITYDTLFELARAVERDLLTDGQRSFMRELMLSGFTHIAQDEDKSIYAYTKKPDRGHDSWVSGGDNLDLTPIGFLKEFLSWDDMVPFSLEELLNSGV